MAGSPSGDAVPATSPSHRLCQALWYQRVLTKVPLLCSRLCPALLVSERMTLLVLRSGRAAQGRKAPLSACLALLSFIHSASRPLLSALCHTLPQESLPRSLVLGLPCSLSWEAFLACSGHALPSLRWHQDTCNCVIRWTGLPGAWGPQQCSFVPCARSLQCPVNVGWHLQDSFRFVQHPPSVSVRSFHGSWRGWQSESIPALRVGRPKTREVGWPEATSQRSHRTRNSSRCRASASVPTTGNPARRCHWSSFIGREPKLGEANYTRIPGPLSSCLCPLT